MKIYLDKHDKDGNRLNDRKVVEAKIIKENNTTFIVELPDGRIIKRKKKRDIVNV